MDERRGQSEVVGAILFLGVVVLLVATAGYLVLAPIYQADRQASAPRVDVQATVTNDSLTLTHAGGRPVPGGQLRVAVEYDGAHTDYDFAADGTYGDDDAYGFGDEWHPDGSVPWDDGDDVRVRLVHPPSDSILYSGRFGANAGTPTADPAPAAPTAAPSEPDEGDDDGDGGDDDGGGDDGDGGDDDGGGDDGDDTTAPSLRSVSITTGSTTGGAGKVDRVEGNYAASESVSAALSVTYVETKKGTATRSDLGTATAQGDAGPLSLTLDSVVSLKDSGRTVTRLDLELRLVDGAGNERVCTASIDDAGQTVERDAFTCQSP